MTDPDPDYHAHDYYHERESREERYQDELGRRNRHLPVILESEGADVPWRQKDDKTKPSEETDG